ncbi:MAG: phosphoadenosine phosphosulfate reductase [Bacillota bacterium]|nr:phosphoadenosine phosphosulfate reductase [Bacillota bacterium]
MNSCKRCVLPEYKDKITLDSEGVCNVCLNYDKIKEIIPQKEQEDDLEGLKKVVEECTSIKKSEYDCAVSISGGKDSLMVLYIAKEILKLRPLGICIDNGFIGEELVQNINNATDALDVDIVTYRTNDFKNAFKHLLLSKKTVYFCRLCHAMIDKSVKEVALKYNINLILGGNTKGQKYVKNTELYWMFKTSDEEVKKEISSIPHLKNIADMFPNLAVYFQKNYGSIKSISPFWYLKWDEEEIIKKLNEKINFKSPKRSWPEGSSNCKFNYVSQYLARQYFGYSQHETELSDLVRQGELTRERAEKLINTPITYEDLQYALEPIGLKVEEVIMNIDNGRL